MSFARWAVEGGGAASLPHGAMDEPTGDDAVRGFPTTTAGCIDEESWSFVCVLGDDGRLFFAPSCRCVDASSDDSVVLAAALADCSCATRVRSRTFSAFSAARNRS